MVKLEAPDEGEGEALGGWSLLSVSEFHLLVKDRSQGKGSLEVPIPGSGLELSIALVVCHHIS
jgi:hypothetical protein